MLNGGDTVIVNPGTYAERVQVLTSGTTGRPLTFQTQGTVVMRGFNIHASYVKVTGFEITNTPGDFSFGPDRGLRVLSFRKQP